MNELQNVLNQFSFIASLQGVLLAIALLVIKRGDRSINLILSPLIFFASWSGFYYTLDLMGKMQEYKSIYYTNFLSDFSYNPLLFLYVLRLTVKDFSLRRIHILHFIPTILLFGYYANFYFAPYAHRQMILDRGYNYFPYDVAVFSYANLLQLLVYLGISSAMLIRNGRTIRQLYSDVGSRNYSWLLFILIFNFITAILCFFLFKTGIATYGFLLSILSALMIYAMAYKMISTPPALPVITSSETAEVVADITKYERSGLQEQRAQLIADKLKHSMLVDKLYLDPDINLKELSEAVSAPLHHVSQVINQHFGKNFFDFINAYRVEEVKLRLQDEKYGHLSLLAIAFDSGFNSKATFNSVFKKISGSSPSEYRNAARKGAMA